MRGMSWRDGGEDDEVSYTFCTIPGPGQASQTPVNFPSRDSNQSYGPSPALPYDDGLLHLRL